MASDETRSRGLGLTTSALFICYVIITCLKLCLPTSGEPNWVSLLGTLLAAL